MIKLKEGEVYGQVKKTLYSLLLDENVVRAVDQLAHRRGCSRSALVNQILAEHLELMTPERRINEVLRTMQSLFLPDPDLVPMFSPNALSMSMKSALDYKYRPTVKYEVELYRSGADSIGELTVSYRTQSADLLAALSRFFGLWKQLEDAYLAPLAGHAIPSAFYDGRFIRSIAAPGRDCSPEELAETISAYVRLLDKLLKGCLSGRLSAADVERHYAAHMKDSSLLI